MRSAGGRRRDSGIVRMVEAAAHRFADDGAIPNNPALPLLVYPGAEPARRRSGGKMRGRVRDQ